jgi:hypothetical protein
MRLYAEVSTRQAGDGKNGFIAAYPGRKAKRKNFPGLL